jgi:hypothetical protein
MINLLQGRRLVDLSVTLDNNLDRSAAAAAEH